MRTASRSAGFLTAVSESGIVGGLQEVITAETLSQRVPVRVPTHLGSVKDEATGLITEGVLPGALEVPGAVLCPKLDDDGDI